MIGAAGLAAAVAAAVSVLVSSDGNNKGLIALVLALVVATPIAVGLWAWYQGPYRRFGLLLIAAGFVWLPAAFAASANDVLYSVGRVSFWLAELLTITLMLSFPSGRLTTGFERALVWATAGLIAVFYMPTAFLVERFPEPGFATTCRGDCPRNVFMATSGEPAFVNAWVVPLREVATLLIFLAVVVILWRRIRGASTLMRRTLTPVLVLAISRFLLLISAVIIRRAFVASEALEPVLWLLVLFLPALAVAFLVGLLRARLFVADSLERLSAKIRNGSSAHGDLRTIVAETLGDPTLEVVYWQPGAPGSWISDGGRQVDPPGQRTGRAVTEIRDHDRLVAAFVHDEALREDPAFVQTAAALALGGLESQRLAAEVDASLQELRESRVRIQAAADDERRRIERDLHDGAQQRLVALRIRLGLAAEMMQSDPLRATAMVREFGGEVEAAIDDVRSLAQGVYPSLLADMGLEHALASAARRSPSAATTTIACEDVRRYPADVESAVYFSCLEAMQNAAKHAAGADSVSISVRDGDGVLRFEVRDSGPGFDRGSLRRGSGLTNMEDRIVAVGGQLTITSRPGEGTRVGGAIPVSTA